jgi:hypothetical protein
MMAFTENTITTMVGCIMVDRGLNTGIIHLADGYDALLLVNAQFVDTIGLMIEAFEA